MHTPLVPCTECSRHVRARAGSCPFCGAARAPTEADPQEGPMPRMSRSVAFSLGAAILAGSSALLDGCGNAQPVYGAPAPMPTQDAAGDEIGRAHV